MNKPNKPVWLDTAKNLIGVKEFPGAPSNPVILNWAKKLGKILGFNYNDDAIPWCGLFATYVLVENNYMPASVPLRASSWQTWGVGLTQPSLGCVLVFTRQGGGHVGFYVSEDADYYHVLGGNQSDKVCIERIAKARCAAIRWPAGTDLPTTGPIVKKFDGTVSTNEA